MHCEGVNGWGWKLEMEVGKQVVAAVKGCRKVEVGGV